MFFFLKQGWFKLFLRANSMKLSIDRLWGLNDTLICKKCLESKSKQNFIRNYIILDIKYVVLDFVLVYDRNHYFGLGEILKPTLADTFIRYCNRYRNHISKEEFSIYPIIKGPPKPNLLPNIKDFLFIFHDSCSISSF